MKSQTRTLLLAACMAALGFPAFAQPGSRSNDDNDWQDRRDNDSDNDWQDRGDDDNDIGWRSRRDGTWSGDRDGRWDPRRDDDRSSRWEDWRDDRDDRNRPTWTRGNQRYEVPNAGEMRSIRSLSQTLVQRVEDMTGEFDRDHRSSGPATYRGAGPVIAFRSAARAFQNDVDRNQNNPERTVQAFQKLKDSHERFNDATSRRDLGSRADRHMQRINETVASLDRLYLRSSRDSSADWNRLQRQANDVDELANRIFVSAKRQSNASSSSRDNSRNRALLERLQNLRDSASTFNEQVRRGARNDSSQRLRESYSRLESAHRAASGQTGGLREGPRSAFAQLDKMIQEMGRRNVQSASSGGWNTPSHGRWNAPVDSRTLPRIGQSGR